MTLPAIPAEDYQSHRDRRFTAKVDAAAQEQQDSTDFLGRVDEVARSHLEQDSQSFLTRVDAVAQQHVPPPEMPAPPPPVDALTKTGAAAPGLSPTTVDLGLGKVVGRDTDRSAALARVHADALASGLDEEGARAAVAIAQTEGGFGGAEGDVAGGGSMGTFQLYFGGGQGNGYANHLRMPVASVKNLLRSDPHAANRWALEGYLGQAIREGQRRGLSGPELATFAQRTGQVSVSPERAGANYAALFGPGGGGVAARGPEPAPAVAVPAEPVPPALSADRAQDPAAIDAALLDFPRTETGNVPAMVAGERYLGPTDAVPLGAGGAAGGTPAPEPGGALPSSSGTPAFRPPVLDHRARVQQAVSGLADALIGMLGGAGAAAAGILPTPPGVNERLAASAREIAAPLEQVNESVMEGAGRLAEQAFPGTVPAGGGRPLVEHAGGTVLGMIGPPSKFEPDPRDFAAFMESRQGVRARSLEGAPVSRPGGFKMDTTKRAEEAYYAAKPAEEEAGQLLGGESEALRTAAENPLAAGGVRTPPPLPPAPPGGPPGEPPIPPPKGDITTVLNQAEEAIKQAAPKIPHPEFLQPEAAMPAQSVKLGRLVFDRVRNVIESMGAGGKELGGRIHQAREGAEVEAQAFLDRMPTVDKLSKPAFTNMVDVLEGNAKPLNPTVAQAAAEAKGVLDDVFSRAENAGVDVAERIDSYFPHVYKDETIRARLDTARRGELIKRLMETNQAATPEEANQIMHRWLQGTERDRRQGNLEMARLANLSGYEKTKEALYNHVLTAMRRVHEVAQFGRDDAIANRLIDRMGAEGYPVKLAEDLFQTAVGAHTYSEAVQNVSRAARAYHSATRLGLAVIGNATQSVNTASISGVLRTIQAMPKAVWSPAEKAFADSTAVTLEAVVKELRQGGGWSDKVLGKAMLGFNEVEKFNRRVQAIAGRDFAAAMARRAAGVSTGLERIGSAAGAKRALEKMRLDAEGIVRRGGKLTPDEEIRAARNMVERSQFRVDPQDLPEWASHPLGKVVAQFKTFSFNQTAFVKRELIDEARKGNVLPLVRFAILAPIAQAAAVETRNVLQGRPPEQDPDMRLLQYALGPLGVGGDIARTFFGINSKNVPPERSASQIVGSLLGPSVGTATEGLAASIAAVRKGDLIPAARLGLRQVPYVGTFLQNKLTPYGQAPATQAAPSGRSSGRTSGRTSGRSSGR